MEKICRSCGRMLPLNAFSGSGSSKDGLMLDCKDCRRGERATAKRLRGSPAASGKRICTKCGEEKNLEDFYRNACYTDGYYWQCKDCVRAYNRKYKQDHPKETREYNRRGYEKRRESVLEYTRRKRRERQERTQAWWSEYRKNLRCQRCGESHPACLDFHHRDPSAKRLHVSRMLGGSYKPEAIIAEIEKCDVLCSNCHRKLHSGGLLDRVGLSRKKD